MACLDTTQVGTAAHTLHTHCHFAASHIVALCVPQLILAFIPGGWVPAPLTVLLLQVWPLCTAAPSLTTLTLAYPPPPRTSHRPGYDTV